MGMPPGLGLMLAQLTAHRAVSSSVGAPSAQCRHAFLRLGFNVDHITHDEACGLFLDGPRRREAAVRHRRRS
jgi:hypothetical protein